MAEEELPLFVHWSQFLHWLFNTTVKFPKRVRFTLSSRIDNLALDILEKIVEARYTREKKNLLQHINLQLETLRVLFRISYEERFLSVKTYEHASRELQRAGEMTGGWLRQQQRK